MRKRWNCCIFAFWAWLGSFVDAPKKVTITCQIRSSTNSNLLKSRGEHQATRSSFRSFARSPLLASIARARSLAPHYSLRSRAHGTVEYFCSIGSVDQSTRTESGLQLSINALPDVFVSNSSVSCSYLCSVAHETWGDTDITIEFVLFLVYIRIGLCTGTHLLKQCFPSLLYFKWPFFMTATRLWQTDGWMDAPA